MKMKIPYFPVKIPYFPVWFSPFLKHFTRIHQLWCKFLTVIPEIQKVIESLIASNQRGHIDLEICKPWALIYFCYILLPNFLDHLGSAFGVRCVRTYVYFYWHMHDFGHVCIDSHFFLWFFLSIQDFSSSYNLILFKNLQLYIWPLIYLTLEETDSLLFTFFTVTAYIT